MNDLERLLTTTEVAALLHLHVNTVRRLGDRGLLRYYRICRRGDRRYHREDVLRFLEESRDLPG